MELKIINVREWMDLIFKYMGSLVSMTNYSKKKGMINREQITAIPFVTKLRDITYDHKTGRVYNNCWFCFICGNEIDKIMVMKRWVRLTHKRRELILGIFGKAYLNFLIDNKDVIVKSQEYYALPSKFSDYVKLIKRGIKVKHVKSMLQK